MNQVLGEEGRGNGAGWETRCPFSIKMLFLSPRSGESSGHEQMAKRSED